MAKSGIKDNICPNCLSRLLDDEGIMVCNGDRLKTWEQDFKRYEIMNEAEKQTHLITFSDSEKFLDLYYKWLSVDDSGNRPNFTCGYTNQIFSPTPETRVKIPDPLQVKRLEKKLKRILTASELTGESQIVVGDSLVKLDMLVFPDDF